MVFKPVTLADSCGFISTYDPAVDRSRICDREIDKHPEWNESNLSSQQIKELAWKVFESEFAAAAGRDPAESEKMLLFKDGETPTRFILGAIATEDYNRIIDDTQETGTHRGKVTERFWRMFLHGLRDIENWNGEVKKHAVGNLQYVDPAWLRSTFIRGLRDVAIQVGSVVLHYNRLTEEEIKN